MKKWKKMTNILPKWSNKKVRNGSYSIGMTALIIAIVVAVNLVVGELPAKFTKVDMSDAKLYSIGEKTEEVVKGLQEDVTIYLIAESGGEDGTLTEILSRYQELSSHIKYEVKDPVLYPNFTTEYTEETVSANSIIVVGEKRSKVIAYSDMYETSMDYTTYTSTTTGFDGEGQITSAIAYATSKALPLMYVLGGHDEMAISAALQTAIEKENIETKELKLLTNEAVPEDADILFIHSPAADLAKEEAEKVITYLQGGGKVIITSAYSEKEMPNFQLILNEYGVGTKKGIVLEGDQNYFLSNYPTYLLPEMQSHEVTSGLDGRYVLLPVSQAVETLADNRDTLGISSLLKTSDSAYIKENAANTESISKEEGDVAGPFDLAVAVTESVDEKETKLLYLADGNMLEEEVDSIVSNTNTEIFTNALSWMGGQENSVSIPSKSTEINYLTLASSTANMLSFITIIALPAVCLLLGGMIWFRRRRR